jgi:hypothetical protein
MYCDEYGEEVDAPERESKYVLVNIISKAPEDKSNAGVFMIPNNDAEGIEIDYDPMTMANRISDYGDIESIELTTDHCSLKDLQFCVALQLTQKHQGGGLRPLAGGFTSSPYLYLRSKPGQAYRGTKDATEAHLEQILETAYETSHPEETEVTIDVLVVREAATNTNTATATATNTATATATASATNAATVTDEATASGEDTALDTTISQIPHLVTVHIQNQCVIIGKNNQLRSPENSSSDYFSVTLDVTHFLVEPTLSSCNRSSMPNKLDANKLEINFYGEGGFRNKICTQASSKVDSITSNSRMFYFKSVNGTAATPLESAASFVILWNSFKHSHCEIHKTDLTAPSKITKIIVPIRIGFGAGTPGATTVLESGVATAKPKQQAASSGINHNVAVVSAATARSNTPAVHAKFKEAFNNEHFMWFKGFSELQMNKVTQWKILTNLKHTTDFLENPCSSASEAMLNSVNWTALNTMDNVGIPEKNKYSHLNEPPAPETREEAPLPTNGEDTIAASMLKVSAERSKVQLETTQMQCTADKHVAVLQLLASNGPNSTKMFDQVTKRNLVVATLKRYIGQIKRHVLEQSGDDVYIVKDPIPTNDDTFIKDNIVGSIGNGQTDFLSAVAGHLSELETFLNDLLLEVGDITSSTWNNFLTYAGSFNTIDEVVEIIEEWATNVKRVEFIASNEVAPGYYLLFDLMDDYF